MEDEISKKPKKPFLVKLADRLVKDQQELDELAVQLALGKAEANDKFEEAKKKMRKRVKKVTAAVSSKFEQNKEWVQSLKGKLANLTDHLGKGKAETPEMYEEQKTNILQGLTEVEHEIQKSPEASKLSRSFNVASEKIKLQMDLFEKKLGAGKKELTKEFHEEMDKAKKKIHAIAARIKEKKDDVDLKLDHFSDELRESYDHLKKAIKSL
jgi:hypothetical protein